MTHLGGQQMGNYRLTRLLGRGGFAEVYLGEHLYVPNTQAAIKVLSERFTDTELQQFCNEVSTIFRLVHPSIVRVLDFGVEGRVPFLVMDYAPRGTLRHLHPEGTQVPLETALHYVKQIAEALQYAHAEKVIHRDIKPENLLIGGKHQILLSDFGIAVKAHRPISQSPQDISGTAYYMAPEQCTGNACQESDQYALAVVVYEWLSGELPFPGKNPFTVALQHIQAPPPPLHAKIPTLSPAVEQVIMKALAKDPQSRFPSVQAFATALEAARQETPQEALPAPAPSLPAASIEPHPADPLPPPIPLPSPALAQPANPVLPRQRRSGPEKDVFRYYLGGLVFVLIGIIALFQGIGHPFGATGFLGIFAIMIGLAICLGSFLFA
jgi:serine/threonine protein kinase